MITITLLTRYILAPIWARLLIFITFYFVIREIHFMDLDFSVVECMMNSSASGTSILSETQRLLSKYEQLCKAEDLRMGVDEYYQEFIPSQKENPEIYTKYQQIYELQEQIRQKVIELQQPPHVIFSTRARMQFNELRTRYGEIFFSEDDGSYFKSKPKSLFYKALADSNSMRMRNSALDLTKKSDTLLLHSFGGNVPDISAYDEAIGAWENLRNNSERDYVFSKTIIQTTEEEIMKLNTTLGNLQKEINEAESRIVSQSDSRISMLEEQQQTFATFDFIEQLKTALLTKQDQIQSEMQYSMIKSTIEQLITQIEISNLKENNEQQISNLQTETKVALSETYSKNFREQIDLRLCFDEKLHKANNEISHLKTQNQELQKTIIQQVAESKEQQELIENVRKSFERKLNEKDLLINELREEKTQIVRNVNDLQQKNDQLTNHVNRLERTFDRDIQSLHRAVDRLLADRNTSKIDDLHAVGLPPASPKY